jgi:hypothetical protein
VRTYTNSVSDSTPTMIDNKAIKAKIEIIEVMRFTMFALLVYLPYALISLQL